MSDISIFNTVIHMVRKGIPLGCLRIVASLEDHGFSVDFHDYQNCNEEHKGDPETSLRFLGKAASDIIGCSIIVSSLPTTLLAIQKLKEEKPDKTVILGGPSATDTPLEIMEHFPVDIIVVGEGEETIVDLMHALEGEKEFSDVPGIIYRDNGEIKVNPRRERIKDLDSVPFPAYHKIDFRDYDCRGAFVTARGCPYKCAFCSVHSVWGRKVIYRGIENVIEEILLVEDEINKFNFYDDTFVLQEKRVMELLQRMKEEKIDMPWSCFGRVNLMTKELLESITSAGCAEIFYGIESGSEKILKRIHKKFTPEQARKIVDETAKYTTAVTSYIWGYPFETMEDFYDTMLQLTLDWKNPKILPMMLFLSPLPQAPITHEYFHQLKFKEDVNSLIASLPKEDHIVNYPSILDVIRKHTKIFSAFYHFNQIGYEKKKEIVDKVRERGERRLGLERLRKY